MPDPSRDEPPGTRHVLQISDMHLRADPGARLLGVNTQQSLCAVLEHALSDRTADVLVCTGDLAHEGTPSTYRRLKETIARYHNGRVVYLPGNHDIAGAMVVSGLTQADADLDGWQIIGFDTHADDEPEACFPEVRFERLRNRVCALPGNAPVLLACHHPPVDVGCPWLDKDRIQSGEELLEWAGACANVKALIFGHTHQVVEAHRPDLRVWGAPATCFQYQPRSRRFAVDRHKPGYRWLHLHPDGRVHASVHRVDDFPLEIRFPESTD